MMWPFRKKPDPSISIIGFTERRVMTQQEIDILLGAGKGLKAYNDLKRHRAQGEKKMKLELNKWYELEGIDGAHKCTPSTSFTHPYDVGGYSYKADGLATAAAPRILSEAPPPLKLEVGALYETTHGVQRCEKYDGIKDGYHLGAYAYHANGSPISYRAPKILYKLRVNEPVSAGGGKVNAADVARDGMADALAYGAVYGDGTRRTFKSMEDFNEWVKHGNSGPRSYTETIRDRLLGEAEEKYAARIFPQVYYHKVHSHEKECYREPVAPEGYEIASPELPFPKDWLMRITDGSKEWWGPFDEIAFCGYSTSGYNVVIRPIAKPFRLEVGAWYEVESYGIHQLKDGGNDMMTLHHYYVSEDKKSLETNSGSKRILRRVDVKTCAL